MAPLRLQEVILDCEEGEDDFSLIIEELRGGRFVCTLRSRTAPILRFARERFRRISPPRQDDSLGAGELTYSFYLPVRSLQEAERYVRRRFEAFGLSTAIWWFNPNDDSVTSEREIAIEDLSRWTHRKIELTVTLGFGHEQHFGRISAALAATGHCRRIKLGDNRRIAITLRWRAARQRTNTYQELVRAIEKVTPKDEQ